MLRRAPIGGGVMVERDTPLNANGDVRVDTLQHHAPAMFAVIAEKTDDYNKFYEQFGKCIKLGVHKDSADRVKVAELLRYQISKSGDKSISFNEYVDRMKEDQGVEQSLNENAGRRAMTQRKASRTTLTA